ncbi:unnamed protein product [Cuscuta campestris]|uniref:Replication factor A C-terminal domain-containing protein n=1 Tax=Cuscuta campestris TaxID=132261 RepID=A0A484M9Q5_9ASTE|nr:unnamed protein product [Cuscuta campestris]
MLFDGNSPEVNEFRASAGADGDEGVIKTTTIKALLDTRKPGPYWIVGKIASINDSGYWCYLGCTDCNKKVTPDGDKFRCSGCNTTMLHGVYRFKVNVQVYDSTGHASFILLDRECKEILGASAFVLREIMLEKNMDPNCLPTELNCLLGVRGLFHVVLKAELGSPYWSGPRAFGVRSLVTDAKIMSRFEELIECEEEGFDEKRRRITLISPHRCQGVFLRVPTCFLTVPGWKPLLAVLARLVRRRDAIPTQELPGWSLVRGLPPGFPSPQQSEARVSEYTPLDSRSVDPPCRQILPVKSSPFNSLPSTDDIFPKTRMGPINWPMHLSGENPRSNIGNLRPLHSPIASSFTSFNCIHHFPTIPSPFTINGKGWLAASPSLSDFFAMASKSRSKVVISLTPSGTSSSSDDDFSASPAQSNDMAGLSPGEFSRLYPKTCLPAPSPPSPPRLPSGRIDWDSMTLQNFALYQRMRRARLGRSLPIVEAEPSCESRTASPNLLKSPKDGSSLRAAAPRPGTWEDYDIWEATDSTACPSSKRRSPWKGPPPPSC